MNKKKIIIILGQTATGKSDFAVETSRVLAVSGVESEIISADSRQVYKGMDLGTGKITRKEMKGVRHHLLDVTSPSKPASTQGGVFSVNDFQKLASKKIEEILAKNKTPIVCGGTGFYIDTLINQTSLPEVPPNKKLRAKLEKESTEKLFVMLKKIDPERAKNIDPKNKVRLIRAIEIAKALGQVPSLHRSDLCNYIGQTYATCDKYSVLKIGLTLPPEILKERIKTRLLSRIKKGMIKEIENLHKQGVSWKRMHQFGLEYRHVSLFLQGKLSKSEMIEKLNTDIWHFAKRQKTWFKRDPNIIWLDPTKKSAKLKALKKIKEFLKS